MCTCVALNRLFSGDGSWRAPKLAFLTAIALWSAPKSIALQSAPGSLLHVESNFIEVNANFTNRRGKSVTDIKPEEISIFDNGKPQKIALFEVPAGETIAPDKGSLPAENPTTKLAYRGAEVHILIAIPGLSFASRT